MSKSQGPYAFCEGCAQALEFERQRVITVEDVLSKNHVLIVESSSSPMGFEDAVGGRVYVNGKHIEESPYMAVHRGDVIVVEKSPLKFVVQ